MNDYAELEVSLQRADGGDYAVELRFRLDGGAAESSLLRAPRPRVRLDPEALLMLAADARAYGERLSAMLFADPRVGEGLAKARAQAAGLGAPLRVRLRLDAGDDSVHGLAWETLRDPEGGGFLFADERVLLSRYLDSPDLAPVERRPRAGLRALVAVADPTDLADYGLAPVDVAGEVARARDALGEIPATVLARGRPGAAAPTLANIAAALRDGPDVFYLVCHGTARAGRPYLWLEREGGASERVAGEEFADRVKALARRPPLVVLVSCRGAGRTHDAGALAAVGPRLAAAGVAATLAMQGDLSMATAERLLPAFFRELRRDGQIDRALAAARAAVLDRRDWWAPALFLRLRDGRLWAEDRPTPQPTPFTRATWRQALRERLTPGLAAKAAAGLIVTTGSLVIISSALLSALTPPPPPPRMTGDFNVAVAEFGALDERGRVTQSEAAADLSDSVHRVLSSELPTLVRQGASAGRISDIKVLGPSDIRRLDGSTPEEQAQAASVLAGRVNADVVIYGNLEPGGRTFAPEFYLPPDKFGGAEELPGQYGLGKVPGGADISRNTSAREEVRSRLIGRTGALAQFVFGLSDYTLGRFDAAASRFEEAAKAPGWDDGDGKEVLYHFMGNTAGKLNDLDLAQRYYARALELEPGYARAQLGAADVLFQKSRGDCSRDRINADGVRAAITGFQGAPAAAVKPALSDIETKAAFLAGRAHACLSQAGAADRWADAERAFQAVITDFRGGNARVKELAAEAHANLGLVYLPAVGEPAAEAKYRRAAGEFHEAIELSGNPDRQAVFYSFLGHIYGRLREYDRAEDAYDNAIRLNPDRRAQYEASREKTRQERAGEVGSPR